jgi:hypothetical protein
MTNYSSENWSPCPELLELTPHLTLAQATYPPFPDVATQQNNQTLFDHILSVWMSSFTFSYWRSHTIGCFKNSFICRRKLTSWIQTREFEHAFLFKYSVPFPTSPLWIRSKLLFTLLDFILSVRTKVQGMHRGFSNELPIMPVNSHCKNNICMTISLLTTRLK